MTPHLTGKSEFWTTGLYTEQMYGVSLLLFLFPEPEFHYIAHAGLEPESPAFLPTKATMRDVVCKVLLPITYPRRFSAVREPSPPKLLLHCLQARRSAHGLKT